MTDIKTIHLRCVGICPSRETSTCLGGTDRDTGLPIRQDPPLSISGRLQYWNSIAVRHLVVLGVPLRICVEFTP